MLYREVGENGFEDLRFFFQVLFGLLGDFALHFFYDPHKFGGVVFFLFLDLIHLVDIHRFEAFGEDFLLIILIFAVLSLNINRVRDGDFPFQALGAYPAGSIDGISY